MKMATLQFVQKKQQEMLTSQKESVKDTAFLVSKDQRLPTMALNNERYALRRKFEDASPLLTI